MTETRLGVDVGGTFTDVVLVDEGRVVTAKVPSTPKDQTLGVLRGCDGVEVPGAGLRAFAHGSTVATNALLERRGAKVALLTTEGFRDILEIARQDRAALYDLTQPRPEPLVPRDLRFTVPERMGPDGELVPLDDRAVESLLGEVAESGCEAVAVCFLFSFLYPDHESRVARASRSALPGVYVTTSHEILPEFREFERFSTTVANAYLVPKMRRYLTSLAEGVRSKGLPEPFVMLSSGGVIAASEAADRAAASVLSGPAGGVVGASLVSGWSGYRDVLSFDMGGTSTDVAPVVDGRVRDRTDTVVAGVPIGLPMVDVHTVGAGGGSIAWVDEGGALRVGPVSAGAEPGPACYQKGGDAPTVTDADLLLGYLGDGSVLGGDIRLSRAHSEAAIARLGEALDLDPVEAAAGIRKVSDAEVLRALRVVSVERGLDPRDFALCAFGGAGPLHACGLAAELGISTVLVPRQSGVLSALGLALSDLRRDVSAPFSGLVADVRLGALEESFGELEARATEGFSGSRCERRADLRYHGQSYELTVAADVASELAGRFHTEHERRYGYRVPDEAVEIVSLRVSATVPVGHPRVMEPAVQNHQPATKRPVYLDGTWIEVSVWKRADMGVGSKLEGPAIVEFEEATCLVPSDWKGAVDDVGTLVLEAS
jgi:N-methylhydantoinase A